VKLFPEEFMARASTKENKNVYFRNREKLGLTREEASEVLGGLTADRIEKIENERSLPHPDEVLLMAEGYKAPQLCNYYCANECPIGQQYVPEIQVKDLSRIILEMIAALNVARKQQERLIEITADGEIQTDEIADFVEIQKTLERISITVETLQLWSEQMLASGAINRELYEKYMAK
jgi:transcriptional regulator with XRE-family HTH domain